MVTYEKKSVCIKPMSMLNLLARYQRIRAGGISSASSTRPAV